jgi:hypothetical protein
VVGDGDDRAEVAQLHEPIVPASETEVQVIILLAAMTALNGIVAAPRP